MPAPPPDHRPGPPPEGEPPHGVSSSPSLVPGARLEPRKDEDRQAARAMRPSMRPMLQALVLNLLLAAGLLGFPLVRGRQRAEQTVQAYVAYAACLHAATPRRDPGLALPDGHRERIAGLYAEAPPEWPGSCLDELERVPQEEVFLLMPGAKTGEEEVRVAVVGARAALEATEQARASDPPRQAPVRLLRTLDHLAAAVSVDVTETGLALDAEHLAFDLGEGPSLVTPSRVPLQTASGGALLVSAPAGRLRVVSADYRSISVVGVHDGTVDVTQVRRPSAARAVLDDGEHAYLGWVTGDATCAHDDARCAHRLTGLARIREGTPEPAPEVWLAAHPAMGHARSFFFEGGSLEVLAREVDGGVSLRTFALAEPWPTEPAPALDPSAEEGERPVPSLPSATVALGAVTDAVVQNGRAQAATGDAETVLACGDHVLVLGAEGVEVRAAIPTDPAGPEPEAPEPAPASIDARVRPPVRGASGLEDAARCASTASGTSFAWIDREHGLRLVPDVERPRAIGVATHVAGFAMLRTGETVTIASWGEDGERSVTLRRIWHGRVLSTQLAAICWDDGSGFCGPAGLVDAGGEAFLYVREGSDLLVLRVTGAGLAALPGLD